MAIDYMIDLPCEPKRALGPEGLLDRLRQLRKFRTGSDEEVRAARQASFELRPLAFHCSGCPANHARREFGCTSTVCLPVSEEAEEWLADRLPPTLNPDRLPDPQPKRRVLAIRELARRLKERGISGHRVDARRATGEDVEAAEPVVRRYGMMTGRVRLSSSQLLELLLFSEGLHADVAETFCRALGAWEDSKERTADGVPEVIFTQFPVEQDDPSVAEIKRMLLALIIACSLDLPVTTSRDPNP